MTLFVPMNSRFPKASKLRISVYSGPAARDAAVVDEPGGKDAFAQISAGTSVSA